MYYKMHLDGQGKFFILTEEDAEECRPFPTSSRHLRLTFVLPSSRNFDIILCEAQDDIPTYTTSVVLAAFLEGPIPLKKLTLST
jgi:hypothetical protein